MKHFAIIQALFYLSAKIGKSLSKIQLLKLMYFSDKLHLIKYGRTISGDHFVAMPLGPLGSTTYDVMKYKASSEDCKDFNALLMKTGNDSFAAKKKVSEVDLGWLSTTNKEVLNTIIGIFGSDDAIALSNYSHTYPEWFKHEAEFKKGVVRVKSIPTTELFSISSAKERLPISREDLEQAKAIYSESCF